MKPEEKMAAEMRQLMQGASKELADAAEKLIAALFMLTTKDNDENREYLRTALQAVNTAPKIGEKDAKVMEKMQGTLAKAAATLDQTLTEKEGYDLNRENVQKARVTPQSRESAVNKVPSVKAENQLKRK